MSALCIQAKDVFKKFGDNVALSNINLSIAEGEFFSFLGPSGCGKTTLLRIIAGFETLSSGELLIDGQDVAKIPAHKRPVNMVFQNYALFPHLTIADNVAFGLIARGNKDKNDIRQKVTESLKLVRLEQFATRYPQQLSGGQQQRVALARAVINRPRVLLLDEPLSALDPQIREQMQEELKALQRALNMTFIMVTHDQNEALAMSHRLAVFSAGRIEQIGQPREVYEKPASLFVARFIGQTNLIEGTIKQIGGESISVDSGLETVLRAPLSTDQSVLVGDSISLHVKPQAIRILPADSSVIENRDGDNVENAFSAVVEGASYQGHTTEYILKAKNGCRVRAITPDHPTEIKDGDTVTVAFAIKDCSFIKSEGSSAAIAAKLAKV